MVNTNEQPHISTAKHAYRDDRDGAGDLPPLEPPSPGQRLAIASIAAVPLLLLGLYLFVVTTLVCDENCPSGWHGDPNAWQWGVMRGIEAIGMLLTIGGVAAAPAFTRWWWVQLAGAAALLGVLASLPS